MCKPRGEPINVSSQHWNVPYCVERSLDPASVIAGAQPLKLQRPTWNIASGEDTRPGPSPVGARTELRGCSNGDPEVTILLTGEAFQSACAGANRKL